MSTKTRHCGNRLGVLTAAFVAVGTGVGAAANQPESAVACDEGGVEPVPIMYGMHATCSIDSSTDTDRFTFEGEAGDRVRYHLDAISGGLDPRMEVRDPTGVIVINEWCGNGCSLALEGVLEATGSFQITVSDEFIDEGGSYRLQIERLPPSEGVPTLKFGTAQQDVIDHTTDMDFFRFEGVAGTFARFTLDSISAGLDPRVQVYDECGGLIYVGSCNNGCSLVTELAIESSGTYSVLMYDGFVDEGGTYEIALDCNFGSCACLQIDLSGDGSIGFGDLLLLLNAWGPCSDPIGCDADLNGNGSIGFGDLSILLVTWGDCTIEPVCSSE